MRKTILLITLVMGVLVSNAQITLTTEGMGVCYWNGITEKFDSECGYDEDTSTRFWFNKDESVLKHTTIEMSSTYYVNSTDHIEDEGLYIYNVISDAGNKYIYFFDIENNEIRCMASDGSYLLFYMVKAVIKE